MARTDAATAEAFNDAVNARDLGRLAALMTDDHRFVDTAGAAIEGKADCLAAWASFLDAYPDYRNVWTTIEVTAPGAVRVDGHSECSSAPLDGPARWYVTVVDGLVAEWRVDDPTPDATKPPGGAA